MPLGYRFLSARDKGQDFLCEGDDDTTGESQKAVGSLRRIVALERKTDLNDTEAKQNQTDGSDESENEIAQVVHNRNRITAGSKSGHGHTHYERESGDDGAVETEALFHLAGHFQLLSILLLSKKFHGDYLHNY